MKVSNWQASQSNGVLLHNTDTDFTSFTVDHALFTTSATGADGFLANLFGTTDGSVNVTNSEFTLIDQDAVQISNQGSGTINAVVSKSNFHDADATGGDGNNTLYLSNSKNGVLNFTIGGPNASDGNTFHNLARLTVLAGVVQVDAAGGDNTTPAGGQINGTIQHNNIYNDAGFTNGRRAIDVQVEADSHNLGKLAVAITDNTVNNVAKQGVHISVVSVGGGSVTDGNWTIQNNQLGVAGTNNGLPVGTEGNVDSGSAIEFETNFDSFTSGADMVNKLLVQGNTAVNNANNATGDTLDITNIGGTAASGTTATLNATVLNNNFTNTSTNGGHVIGILNSSAGDGETLNLNISGNNTTLGASTLGEIRLRELNGTFNVQGGTAAVSGNNSGDTVVLTGTFGTVASVPLPSAPVAFLFASAGGVASAAATPGETHLSQDQLDYVIAAAIAQWAHAGASAAQLAALSALTFSVADFDGNTVGEQTPGHILIDTDAAGHGWFVDATPNDNFEFTHAANAAGTDLFTDPSNAAAGHLDLLTAVVHEMGHELGLPDLTTAAAAHDLMHIDLVDGERRLPDATDVLQAGGNSLPPAVASGFTVQPPAPAVVADNHPAVVAENHATIRGSGGPVPAVSAENFVFASTPANAPAQVAAASLIQGDHFDFSALRSALDHSTLPPAVDHLIETLQALVADTRSHDAGSGLSVLAHAVLDGLPNLHTHLDLHL